MKQIRVTRKKILILISFFIVFQTPYAYTAEEIAFVNGAFRRNLSIKDVEKFASTGKANGLMKDVIKFTGDQPKEILSLLNDKIELPIVLTSKLMNSKIGEVMIKRTAKIIYPVKIQKNSVSIPAIRSAIIKGLVLGDGKINLLSFLKSYPNKIIAVNIPALYKVIKKVESISQLVKFFSDAPLHKLKKGST